MDCSNGYCENIKDKMEKKPRKKTMKDLFEKGSHKMPNGETHSGKTHTKKSKLIKCPKGHKICMCNPKKPKCKKIVNKKKK